MGLTNAQRAIITATVPILKTGGEALTTHFYQLMFRDYPSVKAFFNPVHQSTGAQPRALANSVLHYAENIEDLSKLDSKLVNQIISKHVALQIQPEQYPIVGKCLLQAIREVLGAETATDAVIDAWAAAYGQLADVLIGAESGVYKRLAEQKGGWAGARKFVVSKKVKESDAITSFCLSPEDGDCVVCYPAGHFLGLQLFVPSADGTTEIRRNYSLSQAADGKTLRITVKREDKGAASTYLHDTVAEGSTLNVFPPIGDFTLPAEVAGFKRNALLLSAGVGITPMFAMLQQLANSIKADENKSAAKISFAHFAHSAAARPFAADVELITKNSNGAIAHHFIDTEAEQCGSKHPAKALERALSCVPAGADNASLEVFILGPHGFMKTMRKGMMAAGVPAEQIHYEFFGPASSLE